MIGQFGESWKSDFYDDQMSKLQNSRLYDHCEFIDVFVKGREPITDVLTKINHITYLGDLEPEIPTNKKLYRAYNHIQNRIWNFSCCYPDYKILFFHSLGVSRSQPDIAKNKHAWRKYLETLLIDNWQQCVELLDYYDCVGTDYVATGRYTEYTDIVQAPHYQGFFWWANTNYIRKLDPNWFYKDVLWQSWLCELWIGSQNPIAYNFFQSDLNHYAQEINPPFDSIVSITNEHIKQLRKTRENYELQI